MHQISVRKRTITGKGTICLLTVLYSVAALVFCCFYLLHNHSYLQRWYFSLNGCFYGKDQWTARFFTPQVKAAGNTYCMIALPLAAVLGAIAVRALCRRGTAWQLKVVVERKDIRAILLLLGAGLLLVLHANRHAAPYMDEVFSAVHCGELHPFQTLSYYMVPNNHILFNTINVLLFRWYPDLLISGRIISAGAFSLLLPLLYFWLRQVSGSRAAAFGIVLAMAVQYPVWGFSAQCRGYSLYLLCEWAAFISLWQYFKRDSAAWLPLYCLATVAGYCTIPTFLSFHITLVAVAVLVQLRRRQWDGAFWKYQAAAGVITGLFYLPALCFSGLKAFLEGDYIVFAYAGPDPLPWLLRQLTGAFRYCFSGNMIYRIDGYAFLPLLALLWLAAWRRADRDLGGLFILLWVPVLLLAGTTRLFPFMRSLTGHFSLTYALVLLLFYHCCCWLGHRWGTTLARRLLFPAGLLVLIIHFVRYGYHHLMLPIYHFDTNRYAFLLNHDLDDLPPGAQVGFSDESFYLLYIGRQKGFQTVKCPDGTEAYYIKTVAEPLPHPPLGQYVYRWKRGDYRIYQLVPDP